MVAEPRAGLQDETTPSREDGSRPGRTIEPVRRTELRNRLYHRRCMDCGFLGAVPLPDSGRALPDLGEVTAGPRQQWAHMLRTARERHKLHGSEYDPVMGQDLGLDEGTPYGVMCGLRRTEGPDQPIFYNVPRRSVYEPDPVPPLPPGFQVRDMEAPGAPPLGQVIAVIQTFVWPLVRPHACPGLMRYHGGLTPNEHKKRREWLHRWKLGAVLTVGIAFLGALLKWLVG